MDFVEMSRVIERGARAVERMRDLLQDCDELLDRYADADQPTGCDHPIPNDAMRMQMEIRALLASI